MISYILINKLIYLWNLVHGMGILVQNRFLGNRLTLLFPLASGNLM